VTEHEKVSRAKAQRRKENPWKRGSALRLCDFAREIFLRSLHKKQIASLSKAVIGLFTLLTNNTLTGRTLGT
jgi:hypothetical protein